MIDRLKKLATKLVYAALASLIILLQGCGGGGTGSSGSSPIPLPDSVPVPDASPVIPPDPIQGLPKHDDRVLEDLIVHGRYVGEYTADRSYVTGDVTLYEGSFYFCYANIETGADSPPGNSQQFDILPLIDSEVFVVDDTFDYGPGPLVGRQTVEGFVWGGTGAGYLNSYVDQNGFLTSSGNTYYMLRELPEPITEFGLVQSSSSAPTAATMAISPNNLQNKFSEMWHVNWYDTRVGASTYWHNGVVGVPASYKFYYNSGLVYDPGLPHEMVLKIRGRFLFGYLDGELAFIELSDMFEILTAAANAVYVQNHRDIAEEEKVERVWIKSKSP